MGIIEFSFAGQTQLQHEQGQGSVGADPHAVHVDTMEEGAVSHPWLPFLLHSESLGFL